MYYKIENKASGVYQELHELRTKELQMKKDNLAAIQEKVGLEFDGFLGHLSQQNLGRTPQYFGFEFKEPEKVDPKIWQRDKDNAKVFVPNKRTKAGREMAEFLLNGLQQSCFSKVFKILDVPRYGRFIFPYVEIVDEMILVYLDDKQEPKDPDVIEITKQEFFDQLLFHNDENSL